MLSEQDIHLIQAYVTDQLDNIQQQAVEKRIKEDAVFGQEAFFQYLVQVAAYEYVDDMAKGSSAEWQKSQAGLAKARSIVEQLGDDLFLGEEINYDAIDIDIDVPPTYSLDIDMYKPLEIYEKRLVSANKRSGRHKKKLLTIFHPKNSSDVIDGNLMIEIANKLNQVVTISIYNNYDDEILTKILEFPPQKQKIDVSSLKPGRYYVKFKTQEYEVAFCRFFVKKLLVPPRFTS